MKTIYKYDLKLLSKQTLRIADLNKVLTVQVQNDKPVLWCIVDDNGEENITELTIEIFSTGHDVPSDIANREYINTFQIGGYVGHVFTKITD